MRVVTNRLPRYGVAILTTASASFLALFLSSQSLRVPFALFAAAVMVSSLEGGLKPGLLATALSMFALSVQYWLLPLPQPPESQGEVVPLLTIFLAMGLLSSYLGRQCWRAIHAAEWIQATLASFADGLIFTDREGKVTFMNPVAHDLTGWNPREAGRRLLGRVSSNGAGESGHPVEHAVVQALQREDNGAGTEPALLVAANGAAQAVDAQAAAVRDRNGGLLGAMLLLRDVTASRQTERELRRREEQFRSLVACAPVGILQMDPECRCVYANCSSQLTGGFDAEEALDEGWSRFLHPEDRARVLPDWTAAMQAGKEFVCEFRFPAPEENPRWVRLRSAPMYSDVGKLIGHVGVFQDITVQKHTEEALRETRSLVSAVAEACADPLFVKNREGKYLLANAPGARLIGKSLKQIIGKDDTELFAAEIARRVRDQDCLALDSGQVHSGEQADFAGDCRVPYALRSMPFHDPKGEVAGVIRVHRDHSQQYQLQTELAKAKEALTLEAEARQLAEEKLREAQAALAEIQNRQPMAETLDRYQRSVSSNPCSKETVGS
jgi:PAS domain S-box-containing protein